MKQQNSKETSDCFFVSGAYEDTLSQLGLNSIDAVFNFTAGENLTKDNLAPYRSRIRFQIESPSTTLFLKRYNRPPLPVQIKNRLAARSRVSCASGELLAITNLNASGVKTPKPIAYGQQWHGPIEKRSFIITEKIPEAESLERQLPPSFHTQATPENIRARRRFIKELAAFVRKFHDTGYRHRDLYLSHIFHGNSGAFYLIDLARTFRPLLLKKRYRIKDIAQLYYSAPSAQISRTDRLRFYLAYTARSRLTAGDKRFIKKVASKARRMAQHNTKHGRAVPFAS